MVETAGKDSGTIKEQLKQHFATNYKSETRGYKMSVSHQLVRSHSYEF